MAEADQGPLEQHLLVLGEAGQGSSRVHPLVSSAVLLLDQSEELRRAERVAKEEVFMTLETATAEVAAAMLRKMVLEAHNDIL